MSDSGSSFGGRADPSARRFSGPGGTPGGVGEFVIGLLLAAVGFYLLFNQVQVTTGYWRMWGGSTFGITLIPLCIGIIMLFVNGRSLLGWILTVGGFIVIVTGILVNLDIYFQRTSLWNTLVMLGLISAGLGLIFKSLRPHRPKA